MGKKINSLVHHGLNWERIIEGKTKISGRECFIEKPNGDTIHVLADIDLISGPKGLVKGGLFIFTKIEDIHKLVNHMAGTQARLSFWDIGI